MQNNNNENTSASRAKAQELNSFNVKWVVTTIFGIWPWLIGSIIVCLIIGNLYLRYTLPIYRSYAELLINDSKKGGSTGQEDIMQLLKVSNNRINVENEIEILKSRSLMIKVVQKLPINIRYFISGKFKTTEEYANKPFEFISPDSLDFYFSCKINIIDVNA